MVPTPSENPSYTLSSATSSKHITDDTHVSPKASALFDIVNGAADTEEVTVLLSSSGVRPSPESTEEVLRLLNGSPDKAIVFFRWAEVTATARVWEAMVDLLGSNGMFDQMWEAVATMREKSFLSTETFSLVFRGYCGAGRADDAVIAFRAMPAYGITPCVDTYAVLIEGFEKEGDVAKARGVFDEAVGRFGWVEGCSRVYDAFLITLVRGSLLDEAIGLVEAMVKDGRFPSLRFFSDAFRVLNKNKDLARASSLWDLMVSNGLLPNAAMFNLVIGLFCNYNKIDVAFRFLDEMVVYGAFPDSVTYNTVFRCLVKNKKVREAGRFFTEMTKNEFPPTHLNCAAAIALFFDGDDPEMALEVWYYMVNNRVFPFEESANMLLIGLCNLGRLTELKRFAEKMIDRNIHVSEATMAKIKQAFLKRGGDACDSYDSLSRKWKLSL